MTCSETLYPSLGRYFKTQTELAHAANRSRDYVWRCITGQRDFTRADKKAISGNILARTLKKSPIDEKELSDALEAWSGRFDEIYRKKT